MIVKNAQHYYLKEFQKIDKGKFSWNWCAFLFGPIWMLYRKMYFYAALGSIIWNLVIQYTCRDVRLIIGTDESLYLRAIFVAGCIFLCVFYGCFGNRLYYRLVKRRIKQNYHLLANYSAVSIPAVLFGVSFFLTTPFLVIFFFIIDYIRIVHSAQTTYNDSPITEQDIKLYLKQNKGSGIVGGVFCVVTYLGLLAKDPNHLLYDLQIIEDSFHPLEGYSAFESELISLERANRELTQTPLNNQVLTIFYPSIFETLQKEADSGNEFARNQLESYHSMVSIYYNKLAVGDKLATKIDNDASVLLQTLKDLLKKRNEEIKKFISENTQYDQEYISSEIDRILGMSEENWKACVLFILNTLRLNREAQIYLRLAEKGSTQYQSKLGRYYIKGLAVSPNGIEQNGVDGMKWLQKAADKNDGYWSGYANYRMARVYINGEAGFKRDYVEANKLLQKAIEQNFEPAVLDLAINYCEGIGVQKDRKKAKELLRKSIKNGNEEAIMLLKEMEKREI